MSIFAIVYNIHYLEIAIGCMQNDIIDLMYQKSIHVSSKMRDRFGLDAN
jgi:hypothetical protein